ncbi:MAG: polyhydroxyalkanoate synthesis repressor PhaR [Gammaproteobacteria bacterium]|nr:polyhydroxyalkanoate synthesis repressor PhaR [Gammaproteobacteria bacterium]
MSDIRIIKKYPNRRLYDTVESRYITLAEIRQLVLDKIDFKVIDKQSQDDITCNILLQVIAEQEQKGTPMLSRDLLAGIIRSYGGSMQNIVGNYLDQSMKLFMSQQQQLRDRVRKIVGTDPVEVVSGIAQKNFSRFKSIQEEVFKTFSRAAPSQDKPPADEDGDRKSE